MVLELALAVLALFAAAAMRPWRMLPPAGPPWAWIIAWALTPLLWSADHLARSPAAQPLSGASLLVLLAGWPLAVPALAAAAVVAVLVGALPAELALHRLVWLGFVPASLALALGAAVRRWLPHHLFVYIFARGFFGTLLATAAAGWLALWQQGAAVGFSAGDLLVGRWLAAWAEAIVTGMLVSIFVAFRPQWLATYSDALYLPRS
ncbi:MAG: hypothetical protein U1E89_07165 [Burkholderiaceae bacterium]